MLRVFSEEMTDAVWRMQDAGVTEGRRGSCRYSTSQRRGTDAAGNRWGDTRGGWNLGSGLEILELSILFSDSWKSGVAKLCSATKTSR